MKNVIEMQLQNKKNIQIYFFLKKPKLNHNCPDLEQKC